MNNAAALPVILVSVACSSTAHLLLKLGANAVFASEHASRSQQVLAAATNPWLWGGLGLHGLALLTWVYALGKAELGFAYPFIALGFVLTMVFAWVFMNEVPSPTRFAGMMLVLSGLVMVARG